MSFIVYDLTFLILFAVFVAVFLFKKKKNLKREGLLFLYRTSWGIKLINYVGKKYDKTLKFFSYITIGVGYILMASMLYLLGKIIWIYLFMPEVVRAVKIPPITPLIPYLPQIFKINFLPPFYFTYWIAILAVIAITHEFAHGIFAAYNKVKIKTTGFGFFPWFLPIFLAAFVELDEKKMAKKKIFPQMAVLSAGTFANVVTGVVFLGGLWLFFSLAFVPSGVIFDNYSYTQIEVGDIASFNGILAGNMNYEQMIMLSSNESLNNIITLDGGKYVITRDMLESQIGKEKIIVHDDAPMIRNDINGVIIKINNIDVSNKEQLSEELLKFSPRDKVNLTEFDGEKEITHEMVLDEHPVLEGSPWLGIAFIEKESSGVLGNIVRLTSSFRDSHIYYKSAIGDLGIFIYNLLWWLILISFSVALINMLPVGIFDGGRFFYLTILGITKSEKIAQKSFSWLTKLFLFILVLIMVFWAMSFF